MLAEARRKADRRGVQVEWVQGDMRELDVGRTFDLVIIAANSLLHLHEADDVVACFRAAQVTRGTWYFSTDSEADFFVAPLEIRSIFPQELPLLLSLGGLRVVERFGDWSRASFTADAALQLVICESG
jgi:SAM-dependent methyltransferase